MSNILNSIKLVEAKRSPEPDYNDPSWDEKVQNIGQKAKQAELLKSKGKEPRTRWNPETKKYYVDFSDQVDEAEEPSALATTGSPLKFIKQSAGKLKPKYKMELINLLKISLKPKQAAVAESLGTPYPGTYEQTNDMFKSRGAKRTGTLTTEQGVAESDLDKYKKYTRPVVKTTPKIERTTNPSGRSTDHVEWKVTTPTGEIHRYKSKKEAQEHFDSFGKQGVAEGYVPINTFKMPTDTASKPEKVERDYTPKYDPKVHGEVHNLEWQRQQNEKRMYNVVRHSDRKVINPEPIKGQTAAEEFMKQNGLGLGNADLEEVSTIRFYVTGIDASGQRVFSEPLPDMKDVRNFYKQHGIDQFARTTSVTKSGGGSLAEGWSQKYKKSINCSHPKGFSQKAHCAGKKKHNESIDNVMEMTCPDCGMCQSHGDNSKDKLDELKCWSGFHRVAGTKAGFPGSCAKNKTNEEEHSESCPHCGGEMVSEELMNEKKDACYYKVKSRYKVWPSAYASGALVKCRKKGADSWGNGGKKNESSILEGIESVDESLHDWFNKEKWVRMDTKGNIKGPCAKEPGEGKPKCLPQAKAQNLGKKGRASAAARKRREDPNPERSGPAINVNTKKKSNENIDEGWKSALGSAALAGAMAMGGGHAQAADLSQYATGYLQKVASGEGGRAMVSIDDAKAELQARANGKQQTTAPARIDSPNGPSGFSKEYLQRAADPQRVGRYLLSVEKAQELLQGQ